MPASLRVDRLPAGIVAVLVLAAAVVPAWRAPIAVILVALVAAAWLTRRPIPIAMMAALPIAVSLSWPAWLGPDVPLGPAGCAEPLSVIAVRRVVVAVVVGLITAIMIRRRGISPGMIGLRRPSAPELLVAAAGGVAVAIGGLVVGPALAEPFFGRLAFERPVQAIVPALGFGLANGLLEELAYRGVLQGLLALVVGRRPAIALQAVVFGIVHVGPEVTDLVPVHVALMTAAGLVAGLIVDRTRSLAIPMGIHVGADVALYFGLACRLAAV